MIIDASNTILGRLAAFAAKQALLGQDVVIVNAEKAVVSGKPQVVFDRWRQRFSRGVPSKGPFIHRSPDRLVRRTVRGMIPYKTPRGREAFKRVMCYVGVPPAFEGKESEFVRLEDAVADKLPNNYFVTVAEISKRIGGHQ